MDSSLVKIDNVIAWDGVACPFTETYSLFIRDPAQSWSLCLRFSFLVPDSQNKQGVVEAFFVDETGGQFRFHQEFNLDNHDIVHVGKFVEMGDCSLSLSDSQGTLETGPNRIKWECVFEDPVLSFRPFPDVFYPFAWPRYKMTYPRFLNHARGQFFINHKKYEFLRIRVSQIHGYGKHYPMSLMAHCVGFEQDSDAAFALFAPRFLAQKGLLPHFPCAVLTMEGETFVFQPVLTFLRRPLKTHANGFDFEFGARPFRFRVAVEREPDQDFLVPDGFRLNLAAHFKIEVTKKNRGAWQTYKILSSTVPGVLGMSGA